MLRDLVKTRKDAIQHNKKDMDRDSDSKKIDHLRMFHHDISR